jgi:hypothetical protein
MIRLKGYGAYFWIALFVLGDIALFSSRAVYLDEPFYIALSQAPRDYGLFFEDAQRVFFGTFYPMFGGGSHPPAVVYYLAGLHSLLGEFDEIPFRLLYSVFGVIAAFGFHGLARLRSAHALGLTLLFAASPAFFLNAQTLMMDVPMLAFLLLGLQFYFHDPHARPEPSRVRLALAAACFTVSTMSGYTALVPLGCLFVSELLTRRARLRLAAIAAAPCLLLGWLALMVAYYDKDPLTPVVRYFLSVDSVAHNIVATPAFIGGVTVVPWLFFLALQGRKGSRAGLLLVAALVAAALSFFIEWKSAGYGLWFILLASSGTGLLLLFAAEAWRKLRSERTPLDLFLAIWFPATVLFFVLVAQFMSARYLLLGLPALYLLLFDKAGAKSLVALVAATAVLSLSIAVADYRFVNSYPAWVSANIVPLEQQGFRILGAAESGLRFYLEERGIPTLATSDLRARGGDLIVRHSTLFKYGLSEHIETMLMVLRTSVLNDAFPLRTFSQEAGAGFHGSSLGVVPFVFSRAPFDRIEIAEVSPLVEALPQSAGAGKPVPVWSPEGPILIQREAELTFPFRLPPRSRIQYELQGSGSLEVADGVLTLRKDGPDPVVWKNLRIVPE